MSSPLITILANLDLSIQGVEIHLDRLNAAQLLDEAQITQDLSHVCHHSDLLRELIQAERPGAQWADRPGLEKLLEDLERAARERLYEQRRQRLLELANELYSGTIRHRFAARTAALDALRQDALRELQSEAAYPEQTKELPGPEAREWLVWAFNLQDEADAEILGGLRKDFPDLERFTGEMEDDYWVPGSASRESAPPSPPSPPATPSAKKGAGRSSAMPAGPTVLARSGNSDTSGSVSRAVGSALPNVEPSAAPPSHFPEPESRPAALSAATEAPPSRPAPAAALAEALPPEGKPEAAAESTPAQEAVDVPLFGSFTAAESSGTSLADRLAAWKGALRERPAMAWGAGTAGFVLLSIALFAVIYHLHRSPGVQPMTTVSAASTEGHTGDGSLTQGDGSTQPAPATQAADANASTPLLHRLPTEGAQNKILFSVESCGRGTPGTIECWGYASNLGADSSRVALDRVDVVDGRGNTFTLDRNAQFGFTGGRSSSIAAGSRLKYSLKVPDQDAQAHTLTLYVDLSAPPGSEYTFRDIPIAR